MCNNPPLKIVPDKHNSCFSNVCLNYSAQLFEDMTLLLLLVIYKNITIHLHSSIGKNVVVMTQKGQRSHKVSTDGPKNCRFWSFHGICGNVWKENGMTATRTLITHQCSANIQFMIFSISPLWVHSFTPLANELLVISAGKVSLSIS